MKKFAIGALVALMAVSFVSAAHADDDGRERGEREDRKEERREPKREKAAFKICTKDAKRTREAALSTARRALKDAQRAAKQTRRVALDAADDDQAKEDAARAAYRTAIAIAKAAYQTARDAAKTAYTSAVAACAAVQPSPSVTPTPTGSATLAGTPTPVPTPVALSFATVATHSTAASCWSVVNGNVYNLTPWVSQHPGGQAAIVAMCGKDASAAFNGQHGGQGRPASELAGFKIGILQ